jgi:hypothetical protein
MSPNAGETRTRFYLRSCLEQGKAFNCFERMSAAYPVQDCMLCHNTRTNKIMWPKAEIEYPVNNIGIDTVIQNGVPTNSVRRTALFRAPGEQD